VDPFPGKVGDGVVGIYTDPRHVMLYTSNGEVRQEFSIVLTGRATGGETTRSDESSEVRWVPRKDLGVYSMDRSMRLRIGPYLEGRATPYLGYNGLQAFMRLNVRREYRSGIH
jgi:hypothetical protein